jgi:hypothetical protein
VNVAKRGTSSNEPSAANSCKPGPAFSGGGQLGILRFPAFILFGPGCSLVAGCATRSPLVLSHGSDGEVEAEAVRIARADLAAGRPRVCLAGTIGTAPVGIPPDSFESVRGLPRFSLPRGCTRRLAVPSGNLPPGRDCEADSLERFQ